MAKLYMYMFTSSACPFVLITFAVLRHIRETWRPLEILYMQIIAYLMLECITVNVFVLLLVYLTSILGKDWFRTNSTSILNRGVHVSSRSHVVRRRLEAVARLFQNTSPKSPIISINVILASEGGLLARWGPVRAPPGRSQSSTMRPRASSRHVTQLKTFNHWSRDFTEVKF